jgi:hypothetical protein
MLDLEVALHAGGDEIKWCSPPHVWTMAAVSLDRDVAGDR